VAKTLALGVNGFLTKPVAMATLLDRLRLLLSR